MPKRELRYPSQVIAWLEDWGRELSEAGSLVLIGSGALLWHADRVGISDPLPEASMDVDPVTTDESVARLGYGALMGSPFELEHGWHVNLMPTAVLSELPEGWQKRAQEAFYGRLKVVVPSVEDLLVPKLRRGEPRDLKHAEWARKHGLYSKAS